MPSRQTPLPGGLNWEALSPVVDRQTLDVLFSVTYGLRRLASSVRAPRPACQPESDGARERGLAEARRLADSVRHRASLQAHRRARASDPHRSRPSPAPTSVEGATRSAW